MEQAMIAQQRTAQGLERDGQPGPSRSLNFGGKSGRRSAGKPWVSQKNNVVKNGGHVVSDQWNKKRYSPWIPRGCYPGQLLGRCVAALCGAWRDSGARNWGKSPAGCACG